ncbi:MAG TPA: hypothetical protein VFL41_09135 [Gaiellaceae bacterium]|nr:hypothetical protein [Gaiellaceae bacterium]
MSWGLRLLILIGGVFAAVVLFFAFRDNGDNGTQAQPQTPSAASTTSTAQEQPPKVFRINTRVPGIKRISIKKDRRVIIIVVGDSTEEVHLHGYDMKALMTPERPAGFSLRADEAGRFEIEFEDSGDEIAELTVTP